jgi:hypothetical protein
MINTFTIYEQAPITLRATKAGIEQLFLVASVRF